MVALIQCNQLLLWPLSYYFVFSLAFCEANPGIKISNIMGSMMCMQLKIHELWNKKLSVQVFVLPFIRIIEIFLFSESRINLRQFFKSLKHLGKIRIVVDYRVEKDGL